MNLNYGYDKDALAALIETADSTMSEHNLVIDYDGEVILDPEVLYPHVAVDSYRFSGKVKDKSLRDPMMIAALYDALEMIMERLEQDTDIRMDSSQDREMSIAA